MLDIKLIRDEPDVVKRALGKRAADPSLVDAVLDVDARRRKAQARADEMRAEQKKRSGDVAKTQGDDKKTLLASLKQMSDEITGLDEQQRGLESEQRDLLLRIPNITADEVPAGGEENNVEIARWGEPRAFGFEPRDHLDIGEGLDAIDIEAGAKVSGSRFAFLRGAAVRLWLGVKQLALQTLIEQGHVPVLPPVLVRREAMEGTGFFPAAEDQIYLLEKDELYLVGTSEVPLAAMHMNETLDTLPLRYVAHSACFRREAGAAGKDTRGIFRNHQFEKVEMFVFTRPESSWAEHERLVAIEESFLQTLGIPYRAVVLAAGDTGAPSAKTVDLECWFPGQTTYRETTSCSNTTDYQARRLNVKMRGPDGLEPVHTLNGTVATSSRTIAALLENYQRADGGI
ncbi:MAG: serine--tRNA ligase, partial [Actinobacteria bacterium]|nr:serine--tRNA ligase [Actinomycetota bacterium]